MGLEKLTCQIHGWHGGKNGCKKCDLSKLRKQFMSDMNDILILHKNFIDDSEGGDSENDNWDFVLDGCNNLFVKWIVSTNEDKD